MKHWRILLILVAVACFGVALSYPIRYRLAEHSNNTELETLSAMRQRRLSELSEAEKAAGQGAEPDETAPAPSETVAPLTAKDIVLGSAQGTRAPEEASAPEATAQAQAEPEPTETARAESTAKAAEASPASTEPAETAQAQPGEENRTEPAETAQARPAEENQAQPAEESQPGPTATPRGPVTAKEVLLAGAFTPEPEAQANGGEESIPPTPSPTPSPSPTPTPSPSPTPGLMDLILDFVPSEAPTATPTPSPTPRITPVPSPTVNRYERTQALPYTEKEKIEFDERRMLPELREIYALNNDLIGWIQIPDTVIDYPVVQSEDEDFYLHHDFFGNSNSNGQIILDNQCDPYTPSYNLIISGHRMNNGSMFAGLAKYQSEDYWEAHRYVHFDTLMSRGVYIVFGAFYSADYDEYEEGFRYNADIKYRLDAIQWLEEIRENQLYDTGVDVQFGDEFITLTTCNYTRRNGRFVLVCRRLREGEKEE